MVRLLCRPRGAVSVSQILPSTAKTVAGELGVPYDEGRLHTDRAYNEMLGRRYLQDMLDRYGGNPVLASAAYNAGPDNVDAWVAQFGDPRTGAISDADFAAKIPINETPTTSAPLAQSAQRQSDKPIPALRLRRPLPSSKPRVLPVSTRTPGGTTSTTT
jgi:soluble lytic murein transglycosylase-like protein